MMAKTKEPSRKLTYFCYPFDIERFYKYETLRRALNAMFDLKMIPVINVAHFGKEVSHLLRVHMAYRLIETCEQLAYFHEEHLTEMMWKELHYAKKMGKPLVKVYWKGERNE